MFANMTDPSKLGPFMAVALLATFYGDRATWSAWRFCSMAKLVFGMSQSLDGYVDGVAGDLELPPPGPRSSITSTSGCAT